MALPSWIKTATNTCEVALEELRRDRRVKCKSKQGSAKFLKKKWRRKIRKADPTIVWDSCHGRDLVTLFGKIKIFRYRSV